MVTGELEADHQVVSSAKYFAALRRIHALHEAACFRALAGEFAPHQQA